MLHFPSIHYTQLPPNKPSIDSYTLEFNESVCKEISKGRYLGPFSLCEIGWVLGLIQTSPLSILILPSIPT